jgi:hypothetical protein
MISVFHRLSLGRIELVFTKGDLLASDLDAVVNSEQTDFILSRNRESLSGRKHVSNRVCSCLRSRRNVAA